MRKTNKITMSAALLALGLILPTIFHATGISGKIFLPMHIPVLLGGLILGGPLGMLIGLVLPIANHLLTGMPALPFLYSMIFELGVYGLVAGLGYRKLGLRLVPSLILAMLVGRLAAGIGFFALAYITTGQLGDIRLFLNGAFVVSLPGIIIQILIIPIIVRQYEKSQRISWM